MLKKFFYILFSSFFFSCSDELKIITNEDTIKLVPSVKEITVDDKALLFPKSINVYLSDPIYQNHSKNFFENLRKLGFHNRHSLSDENSAQILIIEDDSLVTDQYNIEIEEKVIINISTISSLSYALNSLLQIAKLKNGRLVLPQIEINDFPDAEYRGLMIDLARKWHTVETLKKLIDLSSFYKLNYIQFHLTRNLR